MTQTTEHVPAYTADHPAVPDRDSLQARIPDWGADLDKEDRPSVPKLKFLDTGAWWDFPERQPEKWPRERSVEHRFLTPVFGTAQPPSGLSGVMRRFAYTSSARDARYIGSSCCMPTVLMPPSITSVRWQLCDRITQSLKPESKQNGRTTELNRESAGKGLTPTTYGWTR